MRFDGLHAGTADRGGAASGGGNPDSARALGFALAVDFKDVARHGCGVGAGEKTFIEHAAWLIVVDANLQTRDNFFKRVTRYPRVEQRGDVFCVATGVHADRTLGIGIDGQQRNIGIERVRRQHRSIAADGDDQIFVRAITFLQLFDGAFADVMGAGDFSRQHQGSLMRISGDLQAVEVDSAASGQALQNVGFESLDQRSFTQQQDAFAAHRLAGQARAHVGVGSDDVIK